MPQSPSVRDLIVAYAKKHRIDPRAALAVAQGEGGLVNREKDRGDGGRSFGAFQLFEEGELPRHLVGKPDRADAWAWSPAGIEHAIRRMAETGARGLRGPAAVEAIIRKFERPADPDSSVRNALGRYGGSLVGTAPNVANGTSRTPVPGVGGSETPDLRRKVALALLERSRQRQSGEEPSSSALLALISQSRQQPVSGSAAALPAPASGEGGAEQPEGFNPEFAKRLGAMVAASGGRLKVNSGYRSYQKQAELYAAALKKYGSEQAARKWVAPPGKSKHNHGIAADLGGDLDWARANAARFGLHFPMSWEPWHVELAGSR